MYSSIFQVKRRTIELPRFEWHPLCGYFLMKGEKSFYMKSPLKQRDQSYIETKHLLIKKLKNKVEDSFNKLCILNLPPIQEYEVVNLLRNYG